MTKAKPTAATWERLEKADRATKPDAPPSPPTASPEAPQAVTLRPLPDAPEVRAEPVRWVVETLGSGAVKETAFGMRDGPPAPPRESGPRWRVVSPRALRRGL